MIQAIAANLFKCFLGLWLLLCPCLAFGQSQQSTAIQVVFDLDWTLLNSTTETMAAADPAGVIRFQDQLYRIPEGSVESLARLHLQGIEISIFSGGDAARNDYAAKKKTWFGWVLRTTRPRFELADQEDQTKKNYSAPNYSEWQRDRNKIVIAVDNILKAVKMMQRNTLSLPEAYYYNDPFKFKFPMCGNLFL